MMGIPGDEPHIRLKLRSQARFLAGARALISNVAQRIGFSDGQCSKIALAVDEALCNVIKHGYGKSPDGWIWMDVWIGSDERPGMTIVVQDRAMQVDPELIRSRDLDDIRPGGLGVHIIREVMDDVRYEKREGGGMCLTMRKDLPTDGENPADAVSSSSAEPSA
jgi:anti-sigma regulatory factor (Ser/Thr protein kinase)